MISFQTEVFRLILALVLGALVGLERERAERGAGVRTHGLVALGSCLVMIVSAFGFADILGTRAVVLDPSRIAAQVVSGIGFLGAGAILFRKEIVQGLNTAASIWVVAAIGLACGGGLLLEAGIVTLLAVGVQIVLRPVHMRFHRTTALHVLHIEASPAEEPLLPRLCSINQLRPSFAHIPAHPHTLPFTDSRTRQRNHIFILAFIPPSSFFRCDCPGVRV
jgi:putative Mg2+ transporter-C (MgtC) family protein